MNSLNLSNETLSDTAFWVAACRSSREDISLDVYAKYWVSKDGFKKHNDYISQVGPNENECVSLRFRYVLDTVRDWVGNGEGNVVVNFAAGVSSLSALLPASTLCIEVDQKSVVDRKRGFYNNLQRANIILEDIDLNNHDELKTFFDNIKLHTRQKNKLTLVFEGILYYLDKKTINFLLKQISELPTDLDILVVSNYWPKNLKDLPIFEKFIKFTENNVSKNDFTFLEPEELNIASFKVREVVGYDLLYKRYLNMDIPVNDIFYEEFVILERASKN